MTTTYSLYTENPLILLIQTETMTRESGEGEMEDGVSWNSSQRALGYTERPPNKPRLLTHTCPSSYQDTRSILSPFSLSRDL